MESILLASLERVVSNELELLYSDIMRLLLTELVPVCLWALSCAAQPWSLASQPSWQG